MDLAHWRKEIDQINGKIVNLLNRRTVCALEIGKIKHESDLPVIDPKREGHVLETVKNANGGPLSNLALENIFLKIIQETRKAEGDAGYRLR